MPSACRLIVRAYRLLSSGMGDRGTAVVKFTISIPRESCTNAKVKYSSSVVPPDPSVHFYHCVLVRKKRSSEVTVITTLQIAVV